MKKSVLLPFERYEHLLKQANSANSRARGAACIASRPSSAPSGKVLISNKNIALPGDRRADVDVILSCFPLNEHEQVRKFLSIFEDVDGEVSYNEVGEVLIGGQLVQGFHVTDALNRMIICREAIVKQKTGDASDPAEQPQVKQTGCVKKRKAVSSNFKRESSSTVDSVAAPFSADQQLDEQNGAR